MDWAGVSSSSEREQGSQAWIKWRGKGLGSSDAAVLLGWSPWKDIHELWEEKLGIRTQEFGFAQRSAMDRGRRLEPIIRKWYEIEYCKGIPFPDDTAEHHELKFMRASYDGRNRALDRVLEIKAPNAKDHELAKNGIITEKHQAQCQWLMMVGKHKYCDYVSYGSDDTYAVVSIEANLEIQVELVKRALVFWNCIENKIAPNQEKFFRWQSNQEKIDLSAVNTQEVLPIDPPQVTEQEIESLVTRTLNIQTQIKEMESIFEALKLQLKEILGKQDKRECGEAVFGWQKRKGSIDYSIIPELIGLDLDQFRKPDIKAFYFKRKKDG